MRSDRHDRRAGLRCSAAVAVLLALTPVGCGAGSSVGGPGGASAPADRGDLAPVVSGRAGGGSTTTTADPVAARSTRLPDELVGRWSRDDTQGVGDWTIELGADGSYREFNAQRGIDVEGRAAVAGRRLYLQPEDAGAQTVTWSVSGGRLSLDGRPNGVVTTYSRVG